jgi:hypothetical protein
MLEAAVSDGADQLGLQQEVFETRGVDADIAALRSGATGDCEVAFLLRAVRSRRSCFRGWCLVGLELVVGVVDKILVVRHVGGCESAENGVLVMTRAARSRLGGWV